MWEVNYFSYIIKKGSNWYMDTGMRDLEVLFLKLILADLMTYVAKIYQIGLYIYAVLNTHSLDMILQLKYMPIVMNPARIASND